MKIYEAEKSLESLMVSKTNSSLCVPIKLSEEKSDSLINSLTEIQKFGTNTKLSKVLASVTEHPELMYGSAILVSTVMNRNDDVFLPEEVWPARQTPVNTPFNDDHIAVDIIGHIIAARPLDSNGNEITETNTIPDYFDIEVDWVVYQGIFPSIAKEIAEKAPIGQKFVSMECKFKNFDYALFDKSEAKIIARNQDTAFLTKYLRAYGGDGHFKDYRIGRVIREITFDGMGAVDVPANPTSEFTKLNDLDFVSNASLSDIVKDSKVVLYVTKGKIMTIETIEQATTVINELTAKAEKAVELQTSVDSLTNDLNAEKLKVTAAEQTVADLKTQIKTLNTELTSVKADLTDKNAQLQKIADDAKIAARLAQLADLGVEITDEQKQKATAMTDEAFASVIEFTKAVTSKPTASIQTQKVTENVTEQVTEATTQATQTLATAEVESTVDVTATAGDGQPESESDKLQKAAAKLIKVVRASRQTVAKKK
jgi:predicted  nucleic acid-binding Zn-ribbon protein